MGLADPRGQDRAAVRTGLAARDVQPAPLRPHRPPDGRGVRTLPSARRGGRRQAADLRLVAVRVRGRRLRVRLLGRRPGRARDVGGAVRRLRERRADHHRPVHRRVRGQVVADVRARAAPAARRTRDKAPSTRTRASSASCPPCAEDNIQVDVSDDAAPVLPSAAASDVHARPQAADRVHAEVAAAASGGAQHARRLRRRARSRRCSPIRTSTSLSRRAARAAVHGQGRDRSARPPSRARPRRTWRSSGSSSSIRSRTRRSTRSSSATRAPEIVWVQEEPENMGAWAFVFAQMQHHGCDDPARLASRERVAGDGQQDDPRTGAGRAPRGRVRGTRVDVTRVASLRRRRDRVRPRRHRRPAGHRRRRERRQRAARTGRPASPARSIAQPGPGCTRSASRSRRSRPGMR